LRRGRGLTGCKPFTGHMFSDFGRLREEGFSGFSRFFRAVLVVGAAAFLGLFGGVGFAVDGFELLDADLGVNRRGFERFVAAELLNEADVGAAFEPCEWRCASIRRK
jgi:hypothetical protein